ncbi:MAG: thiol peroxidase [Micrococcales bacterium]|nr:thiol peroxidase [Micrococcales bacterium]MCL2668347.1 thiol peroxidase [Micrococcales bacterium]
MATTEFNGTSIQTAGDLPSVGTQLPPFVLTGADLGDVTSASLEGRRVVFNIFPSIDTSVCATSVRQFNQRAASLPNTTVVCASNDLPFALGRFCAAEGIENVVTASAFRSSFGDDYGVLMVDGPLEGLLARAIVIADAQGTVRYVELVPSIAQEPDYDAAVAAVQAA